MSRPFEPFATFVSLVTFVTLAAPDAAASQKSRELTASAFDAAYNLDYADAVRLLDQAIAADPNDGEAHRAIAVTAWLRIAFLRGSVTVDDYLGSITKPNINLTPPPAEDAQRFQRHIARALELAETALRARPQDPDTHFAVGSVVGIQATYGATVEGRVLASFRMAKRAFDEHERVLELAPARKDAALSLPMRMMAYVAGFGGGRELGLRMIEEAAGIRGPTEIEAKFALLLLYNRERRFNDALRVVRELQQRYPKNRLLWLEAGATLIRANRFDEALTMLDTGFDRLQSDQRDRMFGEMALWHYKRAVARARLGRREEAKQELDQALATQARDWVQGRSHAELGRLAQAAGQREQAQSEYRLAIGLAERGNDPIGKAEAEIALRSLR
jgi:tetratricopeptide (TPR) repeat protein